MQIKGCAASTLLLPGAAPMLRGALAKYPANYGQVFDAIHSLLVDHGEATTLELAALISWKRVRNAPWTRALLEMPDASVQAITREAFSFDLSDQQRIDALQDLPGFRGGGAFTSVLLTAWDPSVYGIYDKLVNTHRTLVITSACTCNWSALPSYWEHLRVIAHRLGRNWTPRMVEMALMKL